MSAPAGWYADPQDGTQMRYWDGTTWTAHISPHPDAPTYVEPRKSMSGGAIVAIIAGGLVLGGLVIMILAAIAIPVFLNQREKAADVAAEGDARWVANEIYFYSMDYGELPEVTWDGTNFVVHGPSGEYSRVTASTAVELSEYVTDGDSFCLAVVSRQGSEAGVHYSDLVGDVRDGPCP